VGTIESGVIGVDRNGAGELGQSRWIRQLVWFFGTVIASAVLANVCIMIGALLALVFEADVSQSVGLAVNWVAFALMVCSYSAALVLILKALTFATTVPFAVWPALAVFPLGWGLLVASSPGSVYAITPVIVAGAGAVVAWLMVGLPARRTHSALS
jgi:hypothetical protein